MNLTPLEIALALVVTSSLGALPPLARRWSERGLHVLVAASAGIFLGMVFLHLVPEMAGIETAGHAHAGVAATSPLPWLAAVLGFGGLYLLERVWLRRRMHDADPHALIWLSTWIGLVLHSLASGIGVAGVLAGAEDVWIFLLPLLWHKLTESFSLSSVLRLSGVRTSLAMLLLAAFVLVTPAGLLAGGVLLESGWVSGEVLTGFAVGTFLYVALLDLLPEVFHEPGSRLLRLAAVAAGVLSAAVTPGHLAEGGELLAQYLVHSWEVLVAMAPWLLGGFLAAGLLAQVLSPRWLSRHLSGEGLRSVALASIAGAPLPLCSCSVLPVAASLRRAGAGRGPTSAFLISTPETGIDSVAVTWAFFGPAFAAFRALASVGSALMSGTAVSWLSRRGARAEQPPLPAPEEACCETVPTAGAEDPQDHGGGLGEDAISQQPDRLARGGFLQRSLRYAFVDIVDDLAGPLALGILLAGVIAFALPQDMLAEAGVSGLPGILLALVVAVPAYVCASASTPIAAALVMKGLSPGAALVFLLAGPAVSVASLTVLRRTLGLRALAVHLTVLCLVTISLGLCVDLFMPGLVRVTEGAVLHDRAHGESLFAIAAAIATIGILGASFLRGLRRRSTEPSLPPAEPLLEPGPRTA